MGSYAAVCGIRKSQPATLCNLLWGCDIRELNSSNVLAVPNANLVFFLSSSLIGILKFCLLIRNGDPLPHLRFVCHQRHDGALVLSHRSGISGSSVQSQ